MAWRASVWLAGSVFLTAAAAAGPQLTGLTHEYGKDSAWLWFPETATSLTLRRGEVSGGYRLLAVDHPRGLARVETPTGELVLRFAAAQETPPVPTVDAARAIAHRATHNAARSIGATADDVPVTDGPPATIDQIAAQARRRLHPTPPGGF